MSEYLYYKSADGRRARVRPENQATFESHYPDAKIYYNVKGQGNVYVPIGNVDAFKEHWGADNVSYGVIDDWGASSVNTETEVEDATTNRREERQTRREERRNDGKTTFGETLKYSAGAAALRAGKLALDLADAAWNTSIIGGAINFFRGKTFDEKLRDEDRLATRWSSALGEKADERSRLADPTGGEQSYVDLIREGKIGKVAQKALASGIESLPMMVAAGTGWGMLLYGAGMAAGEYADETRENPDIPSWKRAINAMGSAAIEMAVERIGGPLNDIGKAGKEITEEMARDILKTAIEEGSSTITKRIVKALKQGAEEGGEELITSFGNDLLGTALDVIDGDADYGIRAQWEQLKAENPDASLTDFAKSKTKEYMDAFIGGAVSGLEISTTTEGIGGIVNRNRESRSVMDNARAIGESMNYDHLYDTDTAVADAKTALAEAFRDKDGNSTIGNEFIESLSADDAYALAGLEDFSYQQRKAFGELAIAKAKSEALNGKLDAMRDEQISVIRERMEKATENGRIVTGMVNGLVVYVRGGKVKNGKVNTDEHGGNGPLLVIDSVTGEERVVNSRDITSVAVLDAEETINGMVNNNISNEYNDREVARTTMSKNAKLNAVNGFVGKKMMINTENGIIEVSVTNVDPRSGKVLVKGKKGDLGGNAIKEMEAGVFYDSIHRNENGEPMFVENGEADVEEEVAETPETPTSAEAEVVAGITEDDDFRDFVGTILVDGTPRNVSVISQDGPSNTIVYEYEDENGNTRRASTTIEGFKTAIQQGAEAAPEVPVVETEPVVETPVGEEVPQTEEAPTAEEAPVEEVELGPEDIDWDALFESDPEAYFIELQNQFGEGAIDMLTAVVEATQEELDSLNKNKGKTQKEIFANVAKKKELQNKIDILNGMIERLTAAPVAEVVEETPTTEEAPVTDVAPVEETPTVDETPTVEEEPVSEDEPTTAEPVVEPAPAEEVPVTEAEPTPEVEEEPAPTPVPEAPQPAAPETPSETNEDDEPKGGAFKRMFETFKAQIAKIVGKASLKDFVSKDDKKPALTGIYHAGGYDYASDSMVLAKIKSKYPAAQEGKIFSVKTGKEITEKAPNYEMPINDALDGKPLNVDIDDIIAFAQTLEEIKKGLDKTTNFYVAIGNSVFRSDVILTAAKMAKQQGLTTILQRVQANRAMAFTGKNGVVLAMPVVGWTPVNVLSITDGRIEFRFPMIKTPTTLKGIQTAKATLEAILPNLEKSEMESLRDTEGIKLVDGKVFVFFDNAELEKAKNKSKDAITYAALEAIQKNGLEVSLSKEEIETLFPKQAVEPVVEPEAEPVAEEEIYPDSVTTLIEMPEEGFIMEDGYIINPVVIEMPGVEGESNKIYLAEHNGKWGVSQYAVMDNGNSSGSEKNGRVQKEWITYDTPQEAIVAALKYFDYYRKSFGKKQLTSAKIDAFMQWVKDTFLKDSGLEVPEAFVAIAPNPVDDPIKEAKKREKSLATQLKRIGIPHEQKQDMAFNAGKAVADMFATREEYDDYAENATDFGEYNADFERGVDASFANRPQNPDDSPKKPVTLENEPKDEGNGENGDSNGPADDNTGGSTNDGADKEGDSGNQEAVQKQGESGSEADKAEKQVKHDYPARKGNATQKILVDTFGLASVTIPNSRKEILNTVYDFMMEMAKMLGISPKAIGNGGWLSIGNLRANTIASARHTITWWKSDKRVYSAELLLKYANVAGIAHEWWHSLDYVLSYFNSGILHDSTTEISEGGFDGRKETLEAVRAVMKAIRDAGYPQRMSGMGFDPAFLDYVLQPTEMAARFFDEYIGNKFDEAGIKIQRLGYLRDRTAPIPEEMAIVVPALENLFKVLHEKEGKKPGTSILYRLGEDVDESIEDKTKNPQSVPQDSSTSPSPKVESNQTAERAQTKDAAKIAKSIESLRELARLSKNEKVVNPNTIVNSLADALNIIIKRNETSNTSKRNKYVLPNGETLSVRLSKHNTSASTYIEFNFNQKYNLAITVKSIHEPNTFKADDAVRLDEYVYFIEDIKKYNGSVLSEIASSLANFLESGVYEDTTKLPKVNTSPEGVEPRTKENYSQETRGRRADEQNAAVDNLVGQPRNFAIEEAVNEEAAKLGVSVTYKTREQMADGHKNDKGYFDPETGEVVVCTENATSIADAIQTILHEAVAHNGLRQLMGNKFNEFINRVYDSLDAETKAKVDDLAEKSYKGDKMVAMEEYMATLAESTDFKKNTLWDKIKSIFEDIINAILGRNDIKIGDNELRYILRASYNNMVNPRGMESVRGWAQDQMMREEYKINEATPEILYRTGIDPAKAAEETAKEAYERIINLSWQEFQRQFQDAMQPVRIAIEAIQQETGNMPIEDYENFLLMFNQASSRSRVEIDEFSRRQYSPIIESIQEIVDTIIEKRGGNKHSEKERAYAYQEIMQYLISKHGLERNAYYQSTKTRKLTAYEKAKAVSKAQKAYEEAIDAINAMELSNEEKFDMLTKAQQQFNAELEEINTREVPDMRDYSGLTSLFGLPPKKYKEAEEEAQRLVDEFESQYGRVDDEGGMIDKLWKRINAATSKTLRHSYESGMLSRQQYNDIKGMFKFYIPLRGFDETTAEDVYSYARFEGNRFNPLDKKTEGRTSLADDPIAMIMNMAESEIVQGNKNRAKQALYHFVFNRPNSLMHVEDVWYLKTKGADGKVEYVKAEPDRAAGETYDEFNERMKALAKDKKAVMKKGKVDVGMRFQDKRHANEHYIYLKINGEEKAVYINGDPKAAQAVNGGNKKELSEAAKKIGGLNRAISSMFTNYSLEFTARNYFRDLLYSHINIDIKEADPAYRKKFRQNWRHNNLRSMVKMLRAYRAGELEGRPLNEDEAAFVEFMRNGGQTGYTLINSVESRKADLEKAMMKMREGVEKGGVKDSTIFKFTLGNIELLNEASELVTRFAAFKTSRDMGRGVLTSINDAKEVTVNFNTKGSQDGHGGMGAVAQYFGWSKYFFNASVQGVQNLKAMRDANKLKFNTVIGGMIATGFLMPVITAAISSLFGGDEDEYWNIPEYERQNNFCVPIGNGKYAKIPLPIGFREMYAIGDTFAAMLFDKKFSRDFKQIGMDFANKIASIVLPVNPLESSANGLGVWHSIVNTALPSSAQFVIQNVTNTDWKGDPLQKEYTYNEDDPQWMKAFGSNPDWMKGLAKWCNEHIGVGGYEGMDWSPEKLDNTLSNLFGGVYTLVKKTGKSMSMIWNEENRKISNVPLGGVVLGSGIDSDDRFVTDAYFEMKDYYDANVNYIKRTAEKFGYDLEDVFEKEKGKHHPKMAEIYSNGTFDFMQEWYKGVKELDELNKELKKLDKKITAKKEPTEQDMLKFARKNDKYLTARREFVNDMLELD